MAAAAKEQPPHWEVRVGIHHGPVVAGIIGKRQFLFDLWGDTVNIAARIVGKARPGTVVISHSGWMRAGMRCQARSQGFVELKGRGTMELVECSALL
jgi:class 3 adenylate cyclase